MGTDIQTTMCSGEKGGGVFRDTLGVGICGEVICATVCLCGERESMDCSMVILMTMDMVERDGKR